MKELKNKQWSWDDITVGKSEAIKAIGEVGEDIDRLVKLISIVSDKTEYEILNLNIIDFQTISKNILSIFKTEPKIKNARDFNFGNFDINYDFKNFTTSQYIDFCNYVATDNLTDMLSTILIPKGKEYLKNYDIEEVKKEIRTTLTIEDANTLRFFFTQNIENLQRYFLRSIRKQTVKEMKQLKKIKYRTTEENQMLENYEKILTEIFLI